jgi:hypothetical protein
MRTIGVEYVRPAFLTMLAEACMETGRLDDGLSALTPTLGPEMHRLKGELFLKQDEIARKQSAKSLE